MIRFRSAAAVACLVLGSVQAFGETGPDPRVEQLLARMTLEEKAGQLNMLSFVPMHEAIFAPVDKALKEGSVGAMFNTHGVDIARALQDKAAESRLGIPLILSLDVVHGYRTIFPTPLGQAASFDMAAIERSERIASKEAAADGVNMLLTPMLDVSRDARWGRVVEGPGESTWLASRIAEARVKGIQGSNLAAKDSTAACVKHFGANGALEGGRDYTAADISERAMRDTYLPPFKAAAEAGATCMMSAFNAPDGVPTVVNRRLLTEILREEWGFGGVVMSDFEAIMETTLHGVASDKAMAAKLAINAGDDLDMQSKAYVAELPRLVREGAVKESTVDDAVRRVLTLKSRMGLFDDPMRGLRGVPEKAPLAADHLLAAQDLAEKSFVLLKNERRVLPFPKSAKKLALIGPLGDSGADTLGPWAARGEPSEAITLKIGLERRLGADAEVAFTPGGSVDGSRDEEIEAAVETARRADVVVLALGERFNQSGEAASRAALGLPGDQLKLARAVLALGKPTVAVVFAGRPLVLTELADMAPAILYAWQPGTAGGTALARTLMGDVSPSGRLPMTLPRAVGQVPIFHDQRFTGRPATVPPKPFVTGYIDESHLPLYPFGHGLTYTDFNFAAPRVERATISGNEIQTVVVSVTNTGKRAGVAVPQLYVRPKIAGVARPIKEFRGYARVELKPGETREILIELKPEDFGHWTAGNRFEIPAGEIVVMTGQNADETTSASFTYRP